MLLTIVFIFSCLTSTHVMAKKDVPPLCEVFFEYNDYGDYVEPKSYFSLGLNDVTAYLIQMLMMGGGAGLLADKIFWPANPDQKNKYFPGLILGALGALGKSFLVVNACDVEMSDS